MEDQNEESDDISSFMALPDLPVNISATHCVFVKGSHYNNNNSNNNNNNEKQKEGQEAEEKDNDNDNDEELLICGGFENGHCYSYHPLKDQYKLICKYPLWVSSSLAGHVVLPCDLSGIEMNTNINKDNNNNNNNNKEKIQNESLNLPKVTLLSFGGQSTDREKYTLVMKYHTVWENTNENILNNKSYHKNKNEWISIPQINIGNLEDDLAYIRAVVSGKKDRLLLFIIYANNHIDIFDFKSFQPITKYTLPFDFYTASCFLNIKDYTNNKNEEFLIHHMILFNESNGISIKYDEKLNTFEYEKLPICPDLDRTFDYSYIHWKNFIVLFGGYDRRYSAHSNKVHMYCIKEKIWKKCIESKLPLALGSSFAVLNQNCDWVHLVSGENGPDILNHHWKIRMVDLIGLPPQKIAAIIECWVRKHVFIMGWIVAFSAIITNYINGESIDKHKRSTLIA